MMETNEYPIDRMREPGRVVVEQKNRYKTPYDTKEGTGNKDKCVAEKLGSDRVSCDILTAGTERDVVARCTSWSITIVSTGAWRCTILTDLFIHTIQRVPLATRLHWTDQSCSIRPLTSA